MARLRRAAIEALALVEEQARVRLHQAANRMEDADPLEVKAAMQAVRALNAVDRLTGFREEHRQGTAIPEGERAPLPTTGPTPRPELGGLAEDALDRPTRLGLRQAWRAWERALKARGGAVREASGPDGGSGVEVDEELQRAWQAWRGRVEEAGG